MTLWLRSVPRILVSAKNDGDISDATTEPEVEDNQFGTDTRQRPQNLAK
jgi:hypothetical protein